MCVSATMPENAQAASAALDELSKLHPDLTLVRGGAAYGGESAPEVVKRLRAAAMTR
jgi:hypothetical protein